MDFSKLMEYQVHLMLGWNLTEFQKQHCLTNEEMRVLILHLLEKEVF